MAGCDNGRSPASLPTEPASVSNDRYLSPTGNDSAPGTAAQPWRTLARGLAGVVPGATLFLHNGTYPVRGLHATVVGTASQPITVRSVPGENAILDGSFDPELSLPSNWKVADARRSIYRSVAVFPSAGRVYGNLSAADGSYQLVPYVDGTYLRADREDYSDTLPFYAGPGVFWNPGDQHLYVRLVPGRMQQRLGTALPHKVDPDLAHLRLAPSGTLLELAGSAYVTFEQLTVRGCENLFDILTGTHHVTLRECDLCAGRYEVVVRAGAHDLVFDSLNVDGRFPPYVARSDVKRPAANPPAHFMQGAAIDLEGPIDAVEIAHCKFRGLFDAIDTINALTHLTIHDSIFEIIRDDAFELSSNSSQVEFHHNVVRTAAAGVSWNGSVAPPPALAGTKYIHHNVIDTSATQLYARDDPLHQLQASWRGPLGDGMATGRPFDSHDTENLDGPDPWKVYQNTLRGGVDVDGDGLGIAYRYPPFQRQTPHEVRNNILVQVGNQCMALQVRVDDGSQVFDGNLWFRAADPVTEPLLSDWSGRDFDSLAAFRMSPTFAASRRCYAPGFEANGVEGDPGLDAEMRPSPTGPAAHGALDLSATGWPGAGKSEYRGARPPR